MASVAQIFGSTLKRTRTQQGLTQQQLAVLTRMSMSFIGEVERGLKAPNLEAVVSMARALRVPVGELVAEFTTVPPQPASPATEAPSDQQS